MSKIVFITFTLLVVASQTLGDSVRTMLEQNLAEILTKSNSSPERNSQCFSIYGPKLTTLTNQYEAAHGVCLDTAAKSTEAVNRDVAPNVAAVNQLHQNICGGFSKCNPDGNAPYDYFACADGAAGEAITMSYTIQTTSKDRMQYLTLREQMISYDKNTCTQKCSQTYVEETSKVHAELQSCLEGKLPVPTTTPAPEVTTA